ncbi:MRG-domain-containing protein [Myxozyma melibiosi]|uniref:Chromatin modification-related protein EAF3 n=1 Tax=Myxozyma melibiosi TaxID=54550 RepID=A0ABR1EZS2_9ASCO
MTATAPPEGFHQGARCLAFHGPLLYESKILKVYLPGQKNEEIEVDEIPEELRDAIAYLIHYKGWKSSWDEWLPQQRVLRWTEENLRLQKELKNEALQQLRSKKANGGSESSPAPAGSADASGGSAVAAAPSSSSAAGSGSHKRKGDAKEHGEARSLKKTRRDADDKEDRFLSQLDVNISIPDVLMAQLVDDWEYVTKNSQLVDLPRKPTVKDIILDFKTNYSKRRLSNAEAEILDEIVEGIQLYFDKCLGSILLYRFERQQYLEISTKNPDKLPREIYGAEHLLRLFVSLPGLLLHTHMDQQSLNVLKAHVEELLKYVILPILVGQTLIRYK